MIEEHDQYKDVSTYHELVANEDVSGMSDAELTACVTECRLRRRKKFLEAPRTKLPRGSTRAKVSPAKKEQADSMLDDLGL